MVHGHGASKQFQTVISIALQGRKKAIKRARTNYFSVSFNLCMQQRDYFTFFGKKSMYQWRTPCPKTVFFWATLFFVFTVWNNAHECRKLKHTRKFILRGRATDRRPPYRPFNGNPTKNINCWAKLRLSFFSITKQKTCLRYLSYFICTIV